MLLQLINLYLIILLKSFYYCSGLFSWFFNEVYFVFVLLLPFVFSMVSDSFLKDEIYLKQLLHVELYFLLC